jgi:hypothetical protein
VAIEPSDEDASGYSFPQKPSELRELSDDEFHKLWRKIAFANKWTYDRIVEFELTIRLTKSLEDFKRVRPRLQLGDRPHSDARRPDDRDRRSHGRSRCVDGSARLVRREATDKSWLHA